MPYIRNIYTAQNDDNSKASMTQTWHRDVFSSKETADIRVGIFGIGNEIEQVMGFKSVSAPTVVLGKAGLLVERTAHLNMHERGLNKLVYHNSEGEYGAIKHDAVAEVQRKAFTNLYKKITQVTEPDTSDEAGENVASSKEDPDEFFKRMGLKARGGFNTEMQFNFHAAAAATALQRNVPIAERQPLIYDWKSHNLDFTWEISVEQPDIIEAKPEISKYVLEVKPGTTPEQYRQEIIESKWLSLDIAEGKFTLEEAIAWTKRAKRLDRQFDNNLLKQVVMTDFDNLSLKEIVKGRMHFSRNNALFISYLPGEGFEESFKKFIDDIKAVD